MQHRNIKGFECKECRKAQGPSPCFYHIRPVEAIYCPHAEYRELSATICKKNEGEQITPAALEVAMEETENKLCPLDARHSSEAGGINILIQLQ